MHSATPLGSYCGGYSAICDIVAKTNDITAKRMCCILLFPRLLIGEELVGHLLGARGVEELGRLHEVIEHGEMLLVETSIARTTVVGEGEHPAEIL